MAESSSDDYMRVPSQDRNSQEMSLRTNSIDQMDIEKPLFPAAKSSNDPGLDVIGGPAEAEMHTPSTNDNEEKEKEKGAVSTVLRIINWMPPRCRYDPKNPPEFTLAMNILLGFVWFCAIYF